MLTEIEPSKPSSLEPVRPVQTRCKVWVWVCLEASSFLQMEPWLGASNPKHMNLSKPDRACASSPSLQVVQHRGESLKLGAPEG